MGDILKINASCSHIRCDQESESASAKGIDGFQPLLLLHFPVKHSAEDPVPSQLLEQYVHHLPGPAKNNGIIGIFQL